MFPCATVKTRARLDEDRKKERTMLIPALLCTLIFFQFSDGVSEIALLEPEPASKCRRCLNERMCWCSLVSVSQCCDRCMRSGCVPRGADLSSLAAFSSREPYVHRTAVAPTDRLQVGQHLCQKASGESAASPHQPAALRIYTEKWTYPTGTDVTFLALTEASGPLEFFWDFGDKSTARTTSKTLIKRFLLPDRYDVSVRVSNGSGFVSSDVYSLVVEKAVEVNRLQHDASILLNTGVTLRCRINAGTNVSYLWNFGDGTKRVGQDIEHHAFNRVGEFMVVVTAFNLVSSASLKGHLFVVPEPCQPPPVKNMGPKKIQVFRYQPVSLGVTFEGPIECNVTHGLLYSWTLTDPQGRLLSIPLIQTHMQDLTLPKHLLHYGTYQAVAKVQVVGSIVYSNYSVVIEVLSSSAVTVISGGTNRFIDLSSNTKIIMDGLSSHDLDFPNNVMSYKWDCSPVNSAESSCFKQHVPTSSAVLKFPASALSPACDLFKFTLTVKSGHRSSSAETFITVRSKPSSIVNITCKECRGSSVNWNEKFSVTAACETCTKNVSYSWKLFLVNASSKIPPESPFCGSVDVVLPSKIKEEVTLFDQSTVMPRPPKSPDISNLPHIIKAADAEPSSKSTATQIRSFGLRTTSPALFSVDSEFALPPAEREEWKRSREPRRVLTSSHLKSESGSTSDYDYYEYSGLEEADSGSPVGRPTGPSSLEDLIPHPDEGDNLVGPIGHGRDVSEKTLLDLDRQMIQPGVFESFVYTGTSSHSITVKPMMLKPRSLYMLEVAASDLHTLQGKAQLFITTRAVPEGSACHVQPSTGLEIHTDFSVFCTSGREDLIYEYSIGVGNSTRKRLYTGRDYQHYFKLPCGDPNNDYKVTIYIEIQDGFGAATRPCPVNVVVMPSFQRTSFSLSSPEQELFEFGLGNLTTLLQLKNNRDIVSYISLLTGVLNRLSLEAESSVELLTRIRSTFTSAISQLTITNQYLLLDVFQALVDLVKVYNQVTFENARQVVKYISDTLSLDGSTFLPKLMWDINMEETLIHILSHVLEAPTVSSRPGIRLTRDVLLLATDSVLMYLQSSKETQYSVNSTFMTLAAWQLCSITTTTTTTSTKTINSTTFYIKQIVQEICRAEQRQCFIIQLSSYKQNPYHWARAPVELNRDVADIKLLNCTTRREIRFGYLSSPIIIEFHKHEERNKSMGLEFRLTHHEVNIHHFNITPELLEKALQIRVEFIKPSGRLFPILLLFRMHDKPTPNVYNARRVYRWKEQMAQIFLPPLFVRDPGIGYMMLLSADNSKTPVNKYTAEAVKYTLTMDSNQCLAWDGLKDWKAHGCTTLQGVTADRISCSCHRLTSFTISHRTMQSSYYNTSINEYTSIDTNLTSCILIVVSVALYVVLVLCCKEADIQSGNSRTFLLSDNKPSDQFFYTVTIYTGLRSRTRMTAKVYVVLYGEKGVSQTRELSSSDDKLFTSNSRNTFIVSAPWSLGRVWQVHLWHDGGGSSASWFLSRVVVRDLKEGCCWIFMAQCWLAVDEGDGRVERRLLALQQGLTFRQLLNFKFAEYLQDLHPWLSVYSRPSHSAHTHVQRLSVCCLHLQAYMCANAVLIHLQEEQCFSELGLIDVALVSMVTGLWALVALPVGNLMSCLFRISKVNKSSSAEQDKVCLPHVFSIEDHGRECVLRDTVSQALYSQCSFSPWTQNAWTKKSEHVMQDWNSSDFVNCNKLPNISKLQRTTVSGSRIEDIEENISGVHRKFSDKNFKHSQSDLHLGPTAEMCSSRTHRKSLRVWCFYVSWILCLCLLLTCAVITGILGVMFSSTQSVLWVQSVFFSLLFCAFAVHPVMILIFAIFVVLRRGEQSVLDRISTVDQTVIELLKYNQQRVSSCSYLQFEESNMHFEKVLAARQRDRYLRHVRPPSSEELKHMRSHIKKRTLFRKTIREMLLFTISLSMAGFLAFGKTSHTMFNFNRALKKQFTWNSSSPFHSFPNYDAWWNWTSHTLLHGLYQGSHQHDVFENNAKSMRGIFSLIGEPVITKMEYTHKSSHQIFSILARPPLQSRRDPGLNDSVFSGLASSNRPYLCGTFGCYEGMGNVQLGKRRSEVVSTLRKLRTTGWTDRRSPAVRVQFSLFSRPYSMFTTVTLLGELTPLGARLTSLFTHSAQLHNHSTTALQHWLLAAELLFLLLSLLQLYFQMYIISDRGWSYWTDFCNWLEVTIHLVSFSRFISVVHHLSLRTDMIERLKKEDFKSFVDLSLVCFWEQITWSLHGILIFLLLVKLCFLLRLNKALKVAASTVTVVIYTLLWPLTAIVILVIALSCLGNLLFHSDSSAFRNIPKSVYSVITHCFGIRRINREHDHKNQVLFSCYWIFLCLVTMALKAVVIGSLLATVKKSVKLNRRKPHLSVSDTVTYIRETVLNLIGRGGQQWNENWTNTNNFILEEFEDLVDELLLRLSAISNSHTLPTEDQENLSVQLCAHDYSDEGDEMKNIIDSNLWEGPGLCNVLSSYEEHSLRSQLQWKTPCHFGQRREMSCDMVMSTGQNASLNIEDEHGKKPKDLQTFLSSNQLISVHTECCERLASNELQCFNSAGEDWDTVLYKSWDTSLELFGVLNSSNRKKNILSDKKACDVLPVEKQETEMGNIPGQCW